VPEVQISQVPEEAPAPPPPMPNVVHQVQQNIREARQDVQADDLDVPTFLRRQAQKA
jgi:hypothetical protein